MEAGWAEVSWRDDRQYIYEYDYVNREWNFYEEYPLTPGALVQTDVQYDTDLGMWKALYYLGGGYWSRLAREDLGITTADRAFNRGEVFAADDVCPILPLSSFDKGYLLIDGMWHTWDMRYPTDVDERSCTRDNDPANLDCSRLCRSGSFTTANRYFCNPH